MRYINKNHHSQPNSNSKFIAPKCPGQKVHTIPRICHHVPPLPKSFNLQLLNQCLDSNLSERKVLQKRP